MRHVLDTSAILAMILEEPGGDAVADLHETSCIGSVNLAEVVTVLARRHSSPDDIRRIVEALSLPVLSTEQSLAIEVGLLAPITKVFGSSLGDRYAMALARRLGGHLITTDRRLGEAASSVGIAVVALRKDRASVR